MVTMQYYTRHTCLDCRGAGCVYCRGEGSILLPNWIVGPLGMLLFLPVYVTRVPREERMMLEQFGEAYRQYMQQTGRLLPRLKR